MKLIVNDNSHISELSCHVSTLCISSSRSQSCQKRSVLILMCLTSLSEQFEIIKIRIKLFAFIYFFESILNLQLKVDYFNVRESFF